MKELRDAFEATYRDLVRHGFVEDDEAIMRAMWERFVSDLQRNVFPSKATQ